MPQLEDTRKLVAKTTPTGSDLIAILDVAEAGNSPVKKATLAQLFQAAVDALPGPFPDDSTAATNGVAVGGSYLQGDGVISSYVAIRTT